MPKVEKRKLSRGEIAELKRVQTWAAKRKQLSDKKPNRNTMAFKPPGYGTGEWGNQND